MSLVGKNVRVRGKWWHYQFDLNGRTRSGSTGLEGSAENQTAAERKAEEIRQKLMRATPQIVMESQPGRKSFAAAADDFIAWAEKVEYVSKKNTAARLRTSMSSCKLFFGEKPVSEISAGDLEAYKEFRIVTHGVQQITLRHDLHALSVFFRYARKRGLTPKNPVEEVKIPSDRDAVREHVVTPDEEDKYLEAAARLHDIWSAGREGVQPNMRDLAILMLELGARPEEILSARAAAVDLEKGTLAIQGGKTRAARRLLDLTSRAREVVERRLKLESPWLFPSTRWPGRHVTQLQATHDRICREAGVSFVIYDLRHTFATRMIAAGVDAPTVASILGHSGLRTIYRYVHPTAEAKKLAMEKYEAANQRRKLKVVG